MTIDHRIAVLDRGSHGRRTPWRITADFRLKLAEIDEDVRLAPKVIGNHGGLGALLLRDAIKAASLGGLLYTTLTATLRARCWIDSLTGLRLFDGRESSAVACVAFDFNFL